MEDFYPCRSRPRGHCCPVAGLVDQLRSFAIPKGEKTTIQRRELSRQCDRIVGPGSSDHSPPIDKSRRPLAPLRDFKSNRVVVCLRALNAKVSTQKVCFDISSHVVAAWYNSKQARICKRDHEFRDNDFRLLQRTLNEYSEFHGLIYRLLSSKLEPCSRLEALFASTNAASVRIFGGDFGCQPQAPGRPHGPRARSSFRYT